jgi:YbbR domain-containing protein
MLLYLCFVVVAAFLWFVKVLDKRYTYTLSIPTQYENLPLNKASLYHLPKTIDATVSTDGITLSRYLLFKKNNTLDFDLAEIARNDKTTLQVGDYELLDSLLPNMTVLDVQPATIAFAFREICAKRVKIESTLDLQFKQQYQLTDKVQFTPDSVTIYGARQLIDTIARVYTAPTTITGIARQSSHQVALQTIENVTFSDTVITAVIDAEQFTEKRYTIPITFVNIPASVLVSLMQQSVTLTVFVGISQVENISETDFKAVANYNERNTRTGEIPVEIVAKPQSATLVHQNPEYVEIIVEID